MCRVYVQQHTVKPMKLEAQGNMEQVKDQTTNVDQLLYYDQLLRF